MNLNAYASHLAESDTQLLGFLGWYNVPGSAEIDFELFNALIEKYDAPLRKMSAPKLPDVFRRACNDANITKRKSIDDTYLNFTMRDAGHDSGFVFRNLVEERVDSENHRLGYREIDRAIFSRDTGHVVFDRQVAEDDSAMPYIDEVETSIRSFLSTKATLMPPIQTREAIRKALEIDLSGVRARPAGGIYFVSLDKTEQVQALSSVYNELADCSLHILPLVDDVAQRGMIRDAFESEAVNATADLMAELAELKASGKKISSNKFEAIRTKYDTQVTKLLEYKAILADSLGKSESALDLVNESIVGILNSVEV